MPGLCGYSWSDYIDAALRQKAGQHGVPLDFTFGTVAVESAFNPQACGDRVSGGSIITGADGHRGMVILDPGSPYGFYVAWECGQEPGQFGFSHGLLQLHTGGGQGDGMLWSQLVDPNQNLDRGLPYMASALNICDPFVFTDFRDAVCCFARYSGHPGWVDCGDYRVSALLDRINCFAREFAEEDPLAFLRFMGCLTSALALPFLLPLAVLQGPSRTSWGSARRLLRRGADKAPKDG